jgi:hypothetical protein
MDQALIIYLHMHVPLATVPLANPLFYLLGTLQL